MCQGRGSYKQKQPCKQESALRKLILSGGWGRGQGRMNSEKCCEEEGGQARDREGLGLLCEVGYQRRRHLRDSDAV